MVGGGGAFAIFLAACSSSNSQSSSSSTSAQSPSNGSTQSQTSQFGAGDAGILEYALTLEYLETDFYMKAAASGMPKGAAALDLGKKFGEEEAARIKALEAALKQMGQQLPSTPVTKSPLSSQSSILQLAATVGNLGAAAYLGQAAAIQSKDVLAAALSIHSVEGRHASALNSVIGKPITPDGAFAKPATMQQMLGTVKPFIVA